MAGLLNTDDELQSYLLDLLTGSKSKGTGFSAGPFSGYYNETQPRLPPATGEPVEPSRFANLNLGHDFGPMRAGLNAVLQMPSDGPTTVSPGVSLGAGPLSLSGNVDFRQGEDPRLRLGAQLNAPLFGGDASIGASLTPQQRLELYAQYKRAIDAQSEVALQFSHSRPYDGTPDTRFGVAYRRRF